MDHEFFTHQLEADQIGWDWLSLQLDDKTELMLFRIRRKDGSIDPYSAGTFVDAHGTATHLGASDFTLKPSGGRWKSPATSAQYPIRLANLGSEIWDRTRSADTAALAGANRRLQSGAELLGRID